MDTRCVREATVAREPFDMLMGGHDPPRKRGQSKCYDGLGRFMADPFAVRIVERSGADVLV